MKFKTLMILVVVALMTAAATTASAKSVAGEWDVTFSIQGNTVPGTLDLKVAGDKLSGTVNSAHTGPGTISNGTWKKNNLSFTMSFAKHESITATGEMKDGTLSGVFKTEGMQGTWTARRKTAGAKSGK